MSFNVFQAWRHGISWPSQAIVAIVAIVAGNLGPIPDIDPLKPATTPMDFSRLGTSLPSAAPGTSW